MEHSTKPPTPPPTRTRERCACGKVALTQNEATRMLKSRGHHRRNQGFKGRMHAYRCAVDKRVWHHGHRDGQ